MKLKEYTPRFLGTEIESLAFSLADADVSTGETGTVTSDIKLFPDKSLHHPMQEGPMVFDDKFREGMIKSFKKSGLKVQLDFNHNSAGSFMRSPSQEEGKAAGWIVGLDNRGTKGLWATVEWNEVGLNAVRNKEYQYISPEFALKQFDKTKGEVVQWPRLFATALTNRPFLENQKTIAASELEMLNAKPDDDVIPDKGEETHMSLKDTPEAGDNKFAESLDKLTTTIVSLNEKLDAQAKATDDRFKAIAEKEKTDILLAAVKAGQITAEHTELVTDLTANASVEQTKKLMDMLDSKTRTSRDSTNTGSQGQLYGFSENEVNFFNNQLGLNVEEVNKFGDVSAYYIGRNKVLLNDGSMADAVKLVS